MRSALALAVFLGILAGSVIAVPIVATASYVDTSVDAQQPTGQAEIDVNVDGGGAWWTSPFWIAIGVVALLLIIAIIAMAARGGGTTVIKD